MLLLEVSCGMVAVVLAGAVFVSLFTAGLLSLLYIAEVKQRAI